MIRRLSNFVARCRFIMIGILIALVALWAVSYRWESQLATWGGDSAQLYFGLTQGNFTILRLTVDEDVKLWDFNSWRLHEGLFSNHVLSHVEDIGFAPDWQAPGFEYFWFDGLLIASVSMMWGISLVAIAVAVAFALRQLRPLRGIPIELTQRIE